MKNKMEITVYYSYANSTKVSALLSYLLKQHSCAEKEIKKIKKRGLCYTRIKIKSGFTQEEKTEIIGFIYDMDCTIKILIKQ